MNQEPDLSQFGEMMRLLQTIFNTTVALQDLCARGDLEKAAELLKKRENLINCSVETWKSLGSDEAGVQARSQYPERVAPLLRAIETENKQLLKTLNGMRSEAVEGLRQIQNRKSILAYTH